MEKLVYLRFFKPNLLNTEILVKKSQVTDFIEFKIYLVNLVFTFPYYIASKSGLSTEKFLPNVYFSKHKFLSTKC